MRALVMSFALWFASSGCFSEPEVVSVPLQPLQRSDLVAEPRGFVLQYGLQRDEQGRIVGMSRVTGVLNRTGILKALVDGLNAELALPRDVPVLVRACDEANAFYDPVAGRIVLCDELFQLMEVAFADLDDPREHADAVLGATAFIFLHEAAHAIFHQLSLHVYAAEEDAADALATYLLVESGNAATAFQGARAFAALSLLRQPGTPLPFWDEHSLDEQRFYAIACLLYGAQPGPFSWLVANQVLPVARAERCPAEYATLQRTAERDLGAHRRR